MNDEELLRDCFRRARSAEAASAPDFGTVLSRRRRPGPVALAAGLVLPALAALMTFSVTEPTPPAVSITEWRSPTAFLLQTADGTLLRDLPQLGLTYEEDIP